MELGQIVADHQARPAACEDLADTPGRENVREHRKEARLAAHHREVQTIALVARAGVRKPVERHLDGAHVAPPTNVTAGRTSARSMRQEALARRAVMRRRTPAPPAGPAQ